MPFNKIKSPTKTINLAGGEAYSRNPKQELATLALTSFLKEGDKFYVTPAEEMEKVRKLIAQIDPLFVAKLAIYARNQGKMRPVSHMAAAEIFRIPEGQKKNRVSGLAWVRRFLDKVVIRPDDALEILAYYENEVIDPSLKKVKNGFARPIPNALWSGLGKSLEKFSIYQLAKYKGKKKQVSLIDLVNVSHAKTEEPRQKITVKGKDVLIDKFGMVVNNCLPEPKTWETNLSRSGRIDTEGKTQEEIEQEKLENKQDAWKEMILSKKIPQFALLRNLKNVLEYTPDLVDNAVTLLIDPERVKNSRIIPFYYLTAIRAVEQLPATSAVRVVLEALDTALNLAVEESAPIFKGNTLIAMDTSGSMTTNNVVKITALFAAILAKTNGADIVRYARTAEYISYNRKDTLVTITNKFQEKFKGGGTDPGIVFDVIENRRYDRIIFLSDEQGWIGYKAPTAKLNAYREKIRLNTKIFSFDLRGYGTSQFPGGDTYLMSGFTESSLELMARLEEDKDALINEIEKIVI